MTTYRQRLDGGVYKQGRATAAPAQTPHAPLEPDVDTNLYCDVCGRGFDSEHGLKIHRTKTHGAENGE